MSEAPFTIEQFYKYVLEGKLMAGKCLNCGKIHLPPRPLCDNCYSQEFEWKQIPGEGKLLTYTTIYIAPPQFQDKTPYTVGIVQLESGLKIPGLISKSEQPLEIGMNLVLDFQHCDLGHPWPKWSRYCFKPA